MNNTIRPQLDFTPLASFDASAATPITQGLGLIWFGQPPKGVDLAQFTLPLMRVPLPLISQTPGDLLGSGELWLGTSPGTTHEFEGIRYRCDGQTLFGTLTCHDPAASMHDNAHSAYARMFRLLAETGYAHLWRTWNFLQDIHAPERQPEPKSASFLAATNQAASAKSPPTLERYRQFNIGRQAAYDDATQAAPQTAPAACALGMREGGFCFAFLAGKIPPILLENPRQTSAYHYPQNYGPRSPTFSRAALIPLQSQHLLLISGTASIVGHESRHVGNVRAQTRETVTNLSEIVAQANDRLPEGERFLLSKLQLRVYVRHPEDAYAVRRELHVCLGKPLNLCFVQADVCRQELLMEIEATGLSISA